MNKIYRVFLLVAVLTVVNAFFLEPILAAPSKISLVMAGSVHPSGSPSKAVVRFIEAVKRDTDGQVVIQYFAGSKLYADKDIPTAITEGACDMALTNLGTWSGVSPSLVALDLVCGMFKSINHYYACEDGLLGKLLSQDLVAKKVHLIGFATLGSVQTILARNKLIKEPSYLKGLLIRSPTLGTQWFVGAFGGTPTFVSSVEVYSALQRGTVDGVICNARTIPAYKWYEPCPYVTWIMVCPGTPFGIVANLDKWNNLPSEIQEIIAKDWAAESDRNRKEALQQDLAAWEFLTKNPKVKTYEVTDEMRRKDWDATAYEFQLKKLQNLLGKEKTEEIIRAIANTK
jgi:C4-dicarboxylate-binding protein DctP